jgi:hypothetical protein
MERAINMKAQLEERFISGSSLKSGVKGAANLIKAVITRFGIKWPEIAYYN